MRTVLLSSLVAFATLSATSVTWAQNPQSYNAPQYRDSGKYYGSDNGKYYKSDDNKYYKGDDNKYRDSDRYSRDDDHKSDRYNTHDSRYPQYR